MRVQYISTLATQTPVKSAKKSTYSVFYKYKLVAFLLCNWPYMCSADIYCTYKEWLLFSSSNFKSLLLKVYAIHTFFVILFFQVVNDTDTQSVTVYSIYLYTAIGKCFEKISRPYFLIQQTALPYDGSIKKKLKSESSKTVPLKFMEKFCKFIWQIYVKDADTWHLSVSNDFMICHFIFFNCRM